MSKKILILTVLIITLVPQMVSFAQVHAGDSVKLFAVTTEEITDIFSDTGETIKQKKFTEIASPGGEEFVAGAYVYNDSLTNGDCVEMNIIIAEYSETEGFKALEAVHLKTVHACPGDNGKFVFTDPLKVDASRTVKAMIWGTETIIPYAVGYSK